MKLPAARSSESFRFGLENYLYMYNGAMTAAQVWVGNLVKQTWHEESQTHVANGKDDITSGTLFRVTQV